MFQASILKPYNVDANTEPANLPPLPVIMQYGEEEINGIYHQSLASAR
jgi:hypothetical protein